MCLEDAKYSGAFHLSDTSGHLWLDYRLAPRGDVSVAALPHSDIAGGGGPLLTETRCVHSLHLSRAPY